MGIERNGIQFELTYDLGLANIAPNGNDDNIIPNRTFSLTTRYFFPNKSYKLEPFGESTCIVPE